MPKRNRARELVRQHAAAEMTAALQAAYCAHSGIIAAWYNHTVTPTEAHQLLLTVDVRLASALNAVCVALNVERPA
jgi:hypothetical protein